MAEKIDVDQLLKRMDDNQREAFTSLPIQDKLLVLFSIEMSNSSRLAVVEKDNIEWRKDAREYRRKREQREDNGSEEVMNTTQKILRAIAEAEAKKFNWSIYFRDRVLPNILSPAILILIYLIASQLRP